MSRIVRIVQNFILIPKREVLFRNNSLFKKKKEILIEGENEIRTIFYNCLQKTYISIGFQRDKV